MEQAGASQEGMGALKRGAGTPSLTKYALQMSYFLELCGEVNEIYQKLGS